MLTGRNWRSTTGFPVQIQISSDCYRARPYLASLWRESDFALVAYQIEKLHYSRYFDDSPWFLCVSNRYSTCTEEHVGIYSASYKQLLQQQQLQRSFRLVFVICLSMWKRKKEGTPLEVFHYRDHQGSKLSCEIERSYTRWPRHGEFITQCVSLLNWKRVFVAVFLSLLWMRKTSTAVSFLFSFLYRWHFFLLTKARDFPCLLWWMARSWRR